MILFVFSAKLPTQNYSVTFACEIAINDHFLSQMKPQQLAEKHKKLTVTYSCNVTDDDYAAFELKKELLWQISEQENQALSVYDLNRKEYLFYRTKFNKELDNMLDNGFNLKNPSFFESLLHPADVPFVQETQVITFDFLNNLNPSERKDYKLILDLTLVHPNGYFYRVVYQSSILELDRDGNLWLVMNRIELISKNSQYVAPQRQLINIRSKKRYLFNTNEKGESVSLTKREIEILRLISQGYESKDIADRLFISTNTVNNHRRKIIRKTNLENMGQVLLYARSIGDL